MKSGKGILFAFAFAAAASFGQGTILWDEAVNGPMSPSSSTPTVVTPFQFGTNTIIGMTEVEPTGPSWSTHPDFFAITVPKDSSVVGVFLSIDKPNVWTWLGEPSFLNELGFSFGPSNGELLSQLVISAIGPGSYGMYLENHDVQSFSSVANYRLDFVVQAIPEPASLWLLLGGVGWLGFRWRREGKPVLHR